MSIYKPCDIRGDAAGELDPALYLVWGEALGRRLDPGSMFVVGGDVRGSTPAFLEALVSGLIQSGMRVLDLGVLPTPMIYFAKRRRNAAGCAIVTASHNPQHVNGLKWMLGERPPTEADVDSMRQAADSRPRDARAVSALHEPRAPGLSCSTDVADEYVEWLRDAARSDLPSRNLGETFPALRIVVDPGNGCWSGRAAGYLAKVFPKTEFVAIHDAPDHLFQERDPDCARPEHLGALAKAVRERGADLGVAFDGDGDRVAFVDEEGAVLKAEDAARILLQSFCEPGALQGKAFVHDVKFSDRVADTARELGGRPLVERSGHAFIRRRMLAEDALFGAEISGHYFYADLAGGDDGLFTACRMISYVAACGRGLSELRKALPPVFMTPDLRVSVPAEERDRALDQVRQAFAGCPQSSVDGVRIDFPGGWALARPSVTEAKLTFRFEGDGEAELESVFDKFCAALPALGDKLRRARDAGRAQAGEPSAPDPPSGVFLIEPTTELESEFAAVAEEYKAMGNKRYVDASKDLAAYLARLAGNARGENLAPGLAPATTFWLVREEGSPGGDASRLELLGVSNLRHHLNENLIHEGGHIGYNIRPSERRKGYGTAILRLMLEKARERGLERVLVTCDTDNVASSKIIQRNRARFESEVVSHHSGKPVSRYWIDLT